MARAHCSTLQHAATSIIPTWVCGMCECMCVCACICICVCVCACVCVCVCACVCVCVYSTVNAADTGDNNRVAPLEERACRCMP